MSLPSAIQQQLRCPATGMPLEQIDDLMVASDAVPSRSYPIVDAIPILIDEDRSIFSVDDYVKKQDPQFFQTGSGLVHFFHRITPGISINLKARANCRYLCEHLGSGDKVLVIGGSVIGAGMDRLYQQHDLEIVGTDVCFGPQTKIVCDGHDLPFADGTFDCVILQAVLEHVLDPQRCVDEAYRVLCPSGTLYAETPFLQPVHMRQYDFTRFTHLGHRRLFRRFEEINSGPCGGPGMALAWSYTYFLRSFSTGTISRRLLTSFAQFTSFFWKYFDYMLIDKPGAFDSAAGYFFIGRKSEHTLPDRDLIEQFRGI